MELVLNVENQDDNHATFLDIEFSVEGDQFKTKTNDKKEDDNKTKYIYSLNHHKEMGKLKTHSLTYCIMDNWENMPYLTHTLDKIYLTGIL